MGLILLAADGEALVSGATRLARIVDRYEASFFLIRLIAFTAYSVHIARRDATAAEQSSLAQQALDHAPAKERGVLYSLAVLAVGLALLIAGGNLLVTGAVRPPKHSA
ncbi:MAG: hypothetical protein ACRENP_06965 [Longimicrobiales bacterium]